MDTSWKFCKVYSIECYFIIMWIYELQAYDKNVCNTSIAFRFYWIRSTEIEDYKSLQNEVGWTK